MNEPKAPEAKFNPLDLLAEQINAARASGWDDPKHPAHSQYQQMQESYYKLLPGSDQFS